MQLIGIYDDSFDLGWHSLLATQVVSRLRERSQLELPLHHIFDYPTIKELAFFVDNAKRVSREQLSGLSSSTMELEEGEI